MKLQNIFSQYGGRHTNLETFRSSEELESPAGKLLVALVNENTWSKDYVVTGRFDDELPSITIEHESFKYQPLGIQPTDWEGWTVRRVEDAVREHLDKRMESVRSEMTSLQTQIGTMESTRDQMDVLKARAAIAVPFPDAGKLEFVIRSDDLYAFQSMSDQVPAYLVRMVDHEPIGGTVRLFSSVTDWYMLPSGTSVNQRYGHFWAALAKSFVLHELEIPADELYCEEVLATTIRSYYPAGRVDRYEVDKVALRRITDTTRIIVKYGSDNLPAYAKLLPPQRRAANVI